jgi:hypothetical protein
MVFSITGQHVLYLSARSISALIGLTFLYMALFMYKDEGGELQNRLVNLWVRVNERHEAFLGRQAAVMKASAGIAERALDWLLGRKLISLQVVVVSFCMSIASLGLMPILDLSGGYPNRDMTPYTVVVIVGVANFLMAIFVSRVLFKKERWFIPVVFVLIIETLCWTLIGFFRNSRMGLASSLPILFDAAMFVLAATVFGLGCDIVLLAVNRRVIKSMARADKMSRLLWGLRFNVFWLVPAGRLPFYNRRPIVSPEHTRPHVAIVFAFHNNGL